MTCLQAQGVTDSELRKEFGKLLTQKGENPDQNIAVGQKMLKIAKDKNEIAQSFQLISDGYLKKSNYNKCIFYGQKADSVFVELNNNLEHFLACNRMAVAYHKSGMEKEAEKYLLEMKRTAEAENDPNLRIMSLFTEANFLYDQKKYAEEIPIKKKAIEEIRKLQKQKYNQNREVVLSEEFGGLAFDYLMCNNINDAKKAILESEKILKKLRLEGRKEESLYFFCKAILFAKENNKDSAKIFFDKAEIYPRKKNSKNIISIILEQRLKYSIDDNDKKSELFKEYSQVQDSINLQYKNTIALNSSQQNKNLSQQKEIKTYFIIASLILLVLILIIIVLYRRRQRVLYKNFKEILDKYEKTEAFADKTASEISTESSGIDTHSEKNKLISEEKEKALLEKLEDFENGTEFTAHGFTLKNLNVILDTNSKYTNYIIKTYREKSFNDYINGLKIKFIIRHLRENPEHLKYKINYLSDLSGFTTHSHFTKVFTNETQISPSKFISMLKKENFN